MCTLRCLANLAEEASEARGLDDQWNASRNERKYGTQQRKQPVELARQAEVEERDSTKGRKVDRHKLAIRQRSTTQQ